MMAKTGGGLVAIHTLFADSALARALTLGEDQYRDSLHQAWFDRGAGLRSARVARFEIKERAALQ